MRFDLCAAVIAVCVVALQCTANANNVLEGNQQRSDNLGEAVVATTTTTAAQKTAELGVITEDSERGRTTEGELQTDHQTEEEKTRAKGTQEAAREEAALLVVAEAGKPITTTTAANVVAQPIGDSVESGENPENPATDPKHEDGSAGKENNAGQLPGAVELPPEVAPVRAEAEAAATQKTTTTTANINSVQLPDNSQTGVQTPRTTTVVQPNSSPPSTPVREAAGGRPEPAKKKGGAEKQTTGDQSGSEARGAHASVPEVKDSAVTPPTSIVKKNNGDDAGVQLNKNSGDKGTQQIQTPDATTTTTEEQKASTETSTTSSAAPTKATSPAMTSTLPKGFKIPQSVDKTDGISSTSLLFSFAALVTFAVTAVAPAH